MTAMPSHGTTLELRPRRSPVLRKDELKNDSARMLVLACVALFLAFQLVSALATGSGLAFLVGLGGGAVLLAVFFVGFRRMRLSVSPNAIERTGGLPAKGVDRADVVCVVRVPIESFRMQEGSVDVLVDREGRCLLRTRDRMWENGDLDRAWAHAGLGIQHVPQTMTFKQLNDWIPGSAQSWERQPIAFAFAAATGLFGLFLLAVIAATLLL